MISVEPERAARGAPFAGYPYVPGNFGEAPIGGAVEEMVRSVANDEEVRHFVVIVIANGATQRLLGLFQPPVDRRRKRKPARSIQANRGTGLDSGARNQEELGPAVMVQTCEDRTAEDWGCRRSCIGRRLTRQAEERNLNGCSCVINGPGSGKRSLRTNGLRQRQIPHLIVLRHLDDLVERAVTEPHEFVEKRLGLVRVAFGLICLKEFVVGAGQIRPQFHGLEQFLFGLLTRALPAHAQQIPRHAIVRPRLNHLLETGDGRFRPADMQQHDALEIQGPDVPGLLPKHGIEEGLGLLDVLVLLVPAVKAGNGKIDFDNGQLGGRSKRFCKRFGGPIVIVLSDQADSAVHRLYRRRGGTGRFAFGPAPGAEPKQCGADNCGEERGIVFQRLFF